MLVTEWAVSFLERQALGHDSSILHGPHLSGNPWVQSQSFCCFSTEWPWRSHLAALSLESRPLTETHNNKKRRNMRKDCFVYWVMLRFTWKDGRKGQFDIQIIVLFLPLVKAKPVWMQKYLFPLSSWKAFPFSCLFLSNGWSGLMFHQLIVRITWEASRRPSHGGAPLSSLRFSCSGFCGISTEAGIFTFTYHSWKRQDWRMHETFGEIATRCLFCIMS